MQVVPPAVSRWPGYPAHTQSTVEESITSTVKILSVQPAELNLSEARASRTGNSGADWSRVAQSESLARRGTRNVEHLQHANRCGVGPHFAGRYRPGSERVPRQHVWVLYRRQQHVLICRHVILVSRKPQNEQAHQNQAHIQAKRATTSSMKIPATSATT